MSDFPSETLTLQWPKELWQTSRVQVTRHYVGQHQVVVAGVYGFAKGPTWPAAAKLTNELLSFLTKNLVLGSSGLVAILGDMNHEPGELEAMRSWESLGWKEAQAIAESKWGQAPIMTCQGATQRDQIWLSPRLADLCTGVTVQDVFLGHSARWVATLQLRVRALRLGFGLDLRLFLGTRLTSKSGKKMLTVTCFKGTNHPLPFTSDFHGSLKIHWKAMSLGMRRGLSRLDRPVVAKEPRLFSSWCRRLLVENIVMVKSLWTMICQDEPFFPGIGRFDDFSRMFTQHGATNNRLRQSSIVSLYGGPSSKLPDSNRTSFDGGKNRILQ